MLEAVVLAGGFGTRLKSLVSDKPKPMANVSGRPFIDYILSDLELQGFEHVVISIGYLGKIIKNHFGSRFGKMELSYAEEDQPLGTGGALKNSEKLLRSDAFFVLNGDTFVEFDAALVMSRYLRTENAVIVGKFLKDTGRYGVLSEDCGLLSGFQEKSATGTGIINSGVYLLKKEIFKQFDIGQKFSFEKDYLELADKRVTFEVVVTDGYFIDIGIPEDYILAQRHFGSTTK